MQYQGLLFRALNPVYARDPLSGEGARRFGGRFNAKGRAALYTSLTPEGAIREINQVGHLQPTTLVCYHADLARIFDTTDTTALARYGHSPDTLSAPDWRDRMRSGKAPTQELAERLIYEGYQGLVTRSYSRAAQPSDLNIVLWDWRGALRVVDDEGRLG